jgi:phosphoglucosamine mutase
VIADGEQKLAKSGRLLIRKSGTEPLIRVMGEDEDQDRLKTVIDEIAGAIEAAS